MDIYFVERDYEPDYEAYFAELFSLEETLANVGGYDDWFVDLPRLNKENTDESYHSCVRCCCGLCSPS